MALTKLNFNEIQGASEALTGININTNVNFKEQISIPVIPPSQDLDGVLWVDPSAGTFKSRINLVNYSNSFKTDLNSIVFSSPNTLSLGGNTGIVNDLVISGTNTVLNVRSNAFGTAQWSILEVQGNLTVASGSTLNLIRTPLIVRGNILGSGTIISPDGANGGTGGAGGPGGTAGSGGTSNCQSPSSGAPSTGSPGSPGGDAPSVWPNMSGTTGSLMPVEYGISGGAGGTGGRGTGGGGGAGGLSTTYSGATSMFGPTIYIYQNTYLSGGSSGSGSNSIFSGGGPTTQTTPCSTGNIGSSFSRTSGGGGAGGAGGNIFLTVISPGGSIFGPYETPPASCGCGGIGAFGAIGNSGQTISIINNPYIGTGNHSSPLSGSNGTCGGTGGTGTCGATPIGLFNFNPGTCGGSGGVGGAGGGTGGANISIYAAGTISSSIKIRPGKGGLTGGSTSLARAQTGSAWLFTINNTSPIDIDLTGSSGNPSGTSGMLTRILTSNASGVSNFFSEILFEPNGITPAKNKIYLTSS